MASTVNRNNLGTAEGVLKEQSYISLLEKKSLHLVSGYHLKDHKSVCVTCSNILQVYSGYNVCSFLLML